MISPTVAITPIPIPGALLQRASGFRLPLPQPRPTPLGVDPGGGI